MQWPVTLCPQEERRQQTRNGPATTTNLKDCPQRPISSSEASIPKGPTTFQINATCWGDPVFKHMSPEVTFHFQTITTKMDSRHRFCLCQSCGCSQAQLLRQFSTNASRKLLPGPHIQAQSLACLSTSHWYHTHVLHLTLSSTIPRNL